MASDLRRAILGEVAIASDLLGPHPRIAGDSVRPARGHSGFAASQVSTCAEPSSDSRR